MARLPADFRVQPLDELNPHDLGTATDRDAPPRDQWPSYLRAPDRWDLENAPPPRMQDESYRMWLSRQHVHAVFWAQQDAAAAPTAQGRGRPRVHAALDGESEAERQRRVNREAQARWRKSRSAGMSEGKAAAHERWQALRQQANELQVEIARARAEYLALP